MQLTLEGIQDRVAYERAHIQLPEFDIIKMKEATKASPKWIHLGAGNIFRGFIANVQQVLLDQKLVETGIIAVETFDYQIIDQVYTPYDQLSVLVLMGADGLFHKKVIGSIADSIKGDFLDKDCTKALISLGINPTMEMISFTITEKGYQLKGSNGQYLPVILKDFKDGLEYPIHTMTIATALLYRRFKAGALPITLVSMDNCSHNGDLLKHAVNDIAKHWVDANKVETEFLDYINDKKLVAFPISMIDKITPRPSDIVKELLSDDGLLDMEIIITDKHSYMAPFVNAEMPEYLVIEDWFANGRPKLEHAGIIFTDRETVNQVETMKVTTCLNPLHTALAVTGCLLGYTLIADEMKNPAINSFIKAIGYDEGLKVVVDPGIINPKAFIDEVVNERLTNPNIPDTPQRIATDTSLKVGIRFGETIKKYIASDELDTDSLKAIPLALALWCRYLMGVDDLGNEMTLSADPQLDDLVPIVKDIQLGQSEAPEISQLLSNAKIFGSNLYDIGLGCKVESLFRELIYGAGAVEKTLNKYFG